MISIPARLRSSNSRLVAIAAAAFTLILLAFVARPLWNGQIYCFGDLADFHAPLRMYASERLRALQLPLWYPRIFGGLYLLGEGQSGVLHPLHWLIYFLLPFEKAFTIDILLPSLVSFPGAYLLFRRWSASVGASLAGAFLLSFASAHMFMYQLGLMNPSLDDDESLVVAGHR